MLDTFGFIQSVSPSTNAPRFRQGVVSAVSGQVLSVRIAGNTTAVTNVRYLNSYGNPGVGDAVWLVTDGADLYAIGQLSSGVMPTAAVEYPSDRALGTTSYGTLIGTCAITLPAPCRVLIYSSIEFIVVGSSGEMVASTSGAGATTFAVTSNFRHYAENVDGRFHSTLMRPATFNAGTTTVSLFGSKNTTNLTTATAANSTIFIEPTRWV
jgi:hypothetical protein